jgi:DNA-binding LacI/PurR family transcriptional regulator
LGRRASTSPTIKDVAKLAKVSVGTVSRVLKQHADVDPALRTRVKTAVQELGYTPLVNGALKNSRLIAFVLCNSGSLPTAHEHLLLGIEEYCSEAKYNLLFTRHQYSSDVEPEKLQLPEVMLTPGLVDCVIVAGTNHENFIEALRGRGLKYVSLANHTVRSASPHPSHNQIRYDDYGGFYAATAYLIQLGHKHVWYIGDTARPWFRNRYEGYAAAMAAHSLEPAAHTVALSDDPYENGLQAVSYILVRKQPLTAIVAGSDYLAFGAREALRLAGRNIPHDVSLIGFEDQPRRSHGKNLTCVCVDMGEVGHQLAKMAIARVEGNEAEIPEVVVPAEIIKRSTCCPVRLDEVMVL